MRLPKLVAVCAVVALCSVEGGGPASAQQTAPSPLELVYTPVTPCRAFDTRATAAINANQTRSFHVSGSADFPPQGGPAHGCGIPSYATAVSLSLISLGQAAAGYLTAFAYNTSRPAAVSLYYQRNVTLANAVIAPLNQGNVSIFSSQQSHVAGDVTGYYAPQIHAYVDPSGQLLSGSRIVSVSKVSSGSYRVVLDRDPEGCSAAVNSDIGPVIASTYIHGGNIYVYTYDTSGEYTNAYFFLSVHC